MGDDLKIISILAKVVFLIILCLKTKDSILVWYIKAGT